VVWLSTATGGRITRLELFEIEDVDRAVARLAELRPDLLRIPPNAATRANDRICECGETEDWDALRALLAPVVFEDRRRLIRMTGDCDMVVRNIQVLWRFGARPQRTLLATAGDRLALQRTLWIAPQDRKAFEVELLDVIEVDAEGHVVASIIFDADDRAAASDEMAERYVRTTVPLAGVEGVVEMIRARRSRDLARIRATLPDDFYFDDHRRTGSVIWKAPRRTSRHLPPSSSNHPMPSWASQSTISPKRAMERSTSAAPSARSTTVGSSNRSTSQS
jgi:hypothetical protein